MGMKRIFVLKAHSNIDLRLKCTRKNFISHYLGFALLLNRNILKQHSSVATTSQSNQERKVPFSFLSLPSRASDSHLVHP